MGKNSSDHFPFASQQSPDQLDDVPPVIGKAAGGANVISLEQHF
jgi:hypothetical protein